MLLGLGGANRPLKFFCLSITVRSLLGADVLFTLSHFFCVCPVVIVVRKDFYRLIWFKEMQCDDGSCIIETQAFECCEVIHMSYVHMSSSMHSLSLSLSIYLSIYLSISLSLFLSISLPTHSALSLTLFPWGFPPWMTHEYLNRRRCNKCKRGGNVKVNLATQSHQLFKIRRHKQKNEKTIQ